MDQCSVLVYKKQNQLHWLHLCIWEVWHGRWWGFDQDFFAKEVASRKHCKAKCSYQRWAHKLRRQELWPLASLALQGQMAGSSPSRHAWQAIEEIKIQNTNAWCMSCLAASLAEVVFWICQFIFQWPALHSLFDPPWVSWLLKLLQQRAKQQLTKSNGRPHGIWNKWMSWRIKKQL